MLQQRVEHQHRHPGSQQQRIESEQHQRESLQKPGKEIIERVDAYGRQPVHFFRGMVDRMDRPQRGGVQQAMRKVAEQIGQQKKRKHLQPKRQSVDKATRGKKRLKMVCRRANPGRNRREDHADANDHRRQRLGHQRRKEPVEGISSESPTQEALLRPGRFDELVYVGTPDAKGREQILGIHVANMPLADDVSLAGIAEKTERFTGADLEDVVLALTYGDASQVDPTRD